MLFVFLLGKILNFCRIWLQPDEPMGKVGVSEATYRRGYAAVAKTSKRTSLFFKTADCGSGLHFEAGDLQEPRRSQRRVLQSLPPALVKPSHDPEAAPRRLAHVPLRVARYFRKEGAWGGEGRLLTTTIQLEFFNTGCASGQSSSGKGGGEQPTLATKNSEEKLRTCSYY